MKKQAKKLAADLAKAKGRPPVRRSRNANQKLGKPWEPTERDLTWYRMWAVEHRGPSEIAAMVGQARQNVHATIKKVAEWLRGEVIDDILTERERQAKLLDHVISEGLTAWRESKGTHRVKTIKEKGGGGDTKAAIEEITTREEEMTGDTAPLGIVLSAAAAKRDLLGLNMPKQVAVEIGSAEGLERVAGKTHEQALKDQAAACLALAAGLTQSEGAGHVNGDGEPA